MSSTTASHLRKGGRLAVDGSLLNASQPFGRWLTADARLRLITASTGDHPSIHRFLIQVFHGPSQAEFQAQAEEPLYEPTDRLLVKRDEQIIAHVRLTKREMHYGPLQLPVGGVEDLATLPEFRHQGCGSVLLAAAERQLVEEGALLGMLRTTLPQFFHRAGWTVCPRHSYSLAGARDILSHLSAVQSRKTPDFGERRRNPLNIRLWRHVEQAALLRLYAENTSAAYGPLQRSEAYWRWLINRHGYDRIYVAINGPDKFDLDEALTPIVGYAAMKEGRIVEVMTQADHPDAAPQLLARACGDAIERDYHPVRIDAPPDHALHQIVVAAGGQQRYHEAEQGEVFMVKLFEPLGVLKLLCETLHLRADSADLPLPCELGLLYEGQKYRLVLSRRSTKLMSGKLGRSYLVCRRPELTQMLMGHLDVKEAVAAGRLEASTRVAADTAHLLFPRLPVWRPPLDDLPA